MALIEFNRNPRRKQAPGQKQRTRVTVAKVSSGLGVGQTTAPARFLK